MVVNQPYTYSTISPSVTIIKGNFFYRIRLRSELTEYTNGLRVSRVEGRIGSRIKTRVFFEILCKCILYVYQTYIPSDLCSQRLLSSKEGNLAQLKC